MKLGDLYPDDYIYNANYSARSINDLLDQIKDNSSGITIYSLNVKNVRDGYKATVLYWKRVME